MNLRILKKLSKRAAPYLTKIGDTREQFQAVKGDNYHGLIIWDLSKLDRCSSVHTEVVNSQSHVATIAPKCRKNSKHPYVKLSTPSHPLKGTIMVGGMCGYYEPEWDEETAWTALESWVWGQFFDYDPVADEAFYTRTFSSPSEIFAAADELLSNSN